MISSRKDGLENIRAQSLIGKHSYLLVLDRGAVLRNSKAPNLVTIIVREVLT